MPIRRPRRSRCPAPGAFPGLGAEYFDRAPGQVIDALTSGFAHLARRRLLRVPEPRRAAAQFAYLVAGEPLDRAMLVGTVPPEEQIVSCARDGVQAFLARYEVVRVNSLPSSRAR